MDEQIGQLLILDHYHLTEQAAIEYFVVSMRREFPDLIFDRLQEGDGWVISLPAQREYTISRVEALAIVLQEDLFWKKDVLVRYVIVRDDEDFS